MLPTRDLAWEGCVNVRDLGGHATEDGAATRFGAVVRADSVRNLSDAGWQALVAYGVRTIVDLRFHEELEADPPAELPVGVVHVPVFPERSSPLWDEVDALSKGEGYVLLVEAGAARFAEAVAAVGEAPDGGVVVHCAVGKDRTGIVAGLLLRLAGVPVEAIADDYALSEHRLAVLIRDWLEATDDEDERLRRMHIGSSPADAMRTLLERLEARHGSVEAFLRAAGADPGALARTRARLRG